MSSTCSFFSDVAQVRLDVSTLILSASVSTRAHDNADQDRQHQCFEIGLTDEVDLYRLQQDSNASDRDAE